MNDHKACTQCKEIKQINEFYRTGKKTKEGRPVLRGKCMDCEKANKKVKDEDRIIPPKEIYQDIVYKKCQIMAYDAHSRIFSPSRDYKLCYRNLEEPFGFESSTELKWFLFNNFYNDIKDLLDKNLVPSIDRKDPSKGYIEGNIRVISFELNTALGVDTVRQKVEMILPNGEFIIFPSVTKCGLYFNLDKSETSRISSWARNDGKYVKPKGYEFRYINKTYEMRNTRI